MSRIGKHPIAVPAGVEVKVDGSTVTVKGPKGTLTKEFKPSMSIAVDGGFVTVTRPDDEKENRALAYSVPQAPTVKAQSMQVTDTLSSVVTGS